MVKENFVNVLSDVLSGHYDIKKSHVVSGEAFELYGTYNQRNAKYFASKKLEYYAFANYDHILYRSYDQVQLDDLIHLSDFGRKMLDTLPSPNEEHMETCITIMIISNNEPDDDVKRFLKNKCNHSKSFSWGLKGWSKLKMIIMVPSSIEVYTNRFGERDKKRFKSILKNKFM